MKTVNTLKAELKVLAATIKRLRPEYKNCQRTNNWDYELMRPYWTAPAEYREKHIAYCILRGTPYENVEPKVRDGNEPNWKKINAYLEEYSEQKTLCDCAI